jgi:hypothetical protein
MQYIKVENGLVVGSPQYLPKSYENISNFDLFDDQTLRQYGWFPYQLVKADLTGNVLLDGYEYKIENNVVFQYEKTRPKTEHELYIEKEAIWNRVRAKRNQELLNCDWTQLEDAPFTPEKKQEWKIYRQGLRDITLQENPFDLIWPSKPE